MLALDRHASKRSQVSRLLEVAGGADAGIMERKSTALLHHGHELVARWYQTCNPQKGLGHSKV